MGSQNNIHKSNFYFSRNTPPGITSLFRRSEVAQAAPFFRIESIIQIFPIVWTIQTIYQIFTQLKTEIVKKISGLLKF